MKRLLSLFLSIVMIFTLITFGVINVSATSLTHTLEEAMAWCESKIGMGINVDNNVYGNQCVEFIKAYYDFLVGYHYRGNACDYATMTVPSGMERIPGASPQPGDVLIWTGGSNGNGHVAICGYNNQSYHQNWSGKYVEKLDKTYSSGFTITSTGEFASYWGVIRPNFADSTPTPQPTYTDISNGTYFLKNNNNGKYLHVESGKDAQSQNIVTYELCNSSADNIKITKDGSTYKLQPTCSSTRVVNAYAWTVSSGTNVNLYDDLGSSETSQRWYFEKVTNGYIIRNAQTPSCVLAADSTDNAYVTTYTGASSQIWTIQNTVKYDANGGSGAPNQQLKDYGKTLTLSSTVPTRGGYNFLGWSESSSATSATYSAGGSFTKNANTTLYAVWAYKTYTVSYNANGGSGAPGSQTKTHGSTLKLSSTVPTRDGYTFVGWSESSSATSATYNAGSNYTNNASVTLYAVWAQSVYTNTIQHWVYVGTGGDNHDGTQKLMGTSTFECESATTVTIPESSIVNYWCYYFTGKAGSNWGTNTFSSKDIGSTFVQPDRSITIEYYYMPKTIEIYYFKTGEEYDWRIGTYVYGNTNYQFGYTDDGILLWEEDELTRPGYKFIGWSETRDATTPDYSTSDYMSESWFTDKVMFSGAKTEIGLYTVWEKVENLLGDVNNDKKVDSLDYLLVKRACFKTYTFSNDESKRADVNGDSKIDSSDYLLVKRIAFGTYKAS